MKSVFKFFTERHLLANALMVMILLGGTYSLLQINREEFPNSDPGMITVRASYASASAEDVELQVTNPLEDALKSVVGIKSMSSTSSDGSVSIDIEVDEDSADVDDVYSDVFDAVTGVNDLPDDVDTPQVTAMDPKMKSIMRFGVTSSTLSYQELRDYVHGLEKELFDVSGVADVGLTGYLDREVRIEVSPDDLLRYDVSMDEVIEAIAAQNIRASSGSLQTATDQKNLITLSLFDEPTDVGDVIVRTYDSGGVVRVRDLATIYDDFEESQTIHRVNGLPTIIVNVTKSANADIIRTAEAVQELLAEEQKALPADTIDFVMMNDDSLKIKDKFNIVKTNGALGLVLVLVVLAAFLNLHTSFWVAMGIPISLMTVMIALPWFNVELDSITMSAMVLVIGIIVDDAIVIAENIFQHRERGKAPLEAAVDGLVEVAMPVFTTVATTVLAFIPMLLVKGMLGKMLYVVPLTVIVSLSASMLESYFILPAHLFPGLRGSKPGKMGRRWFYPVRNVFERILRQYLLPLRYVWLFAACLLLVATCFYGMTSLRFLLFPRGGSTTETIYLTVELPLGTPLSTTDDVMEELETVAATFPKTEIAAYYVEVGAGGGFREAAGTNRGTMTLYLPTASSMTRSVSEITGDLQQQTAHIEGLTLGRTWRGFSAGEAIEIQVKGSDLTTRNRAVEDVMAFLSEIDGVSGLERDDKSGTEQLVILPNHALLGRYGLTVSDISASLRTLYDGDVATTTRYGDEDVDFRVVLQANERQRLDYFKQVKITNNTGEAINLSEIATFEIRQGLYALYHEDGEPTITITGDMDEAALTPLEVMALVEEHFDFYKMREYSGVRLDISGEAAQSQQAISDILLSFGLAAVGSYFLLMILFESITQPLIVLVTIPFGVVGVILAFVLHGFTEITFFAGIGMVGLSGVVVNDALVLVDHLNSLKKRYAGCDMTAVIAEGAANRLRPVILTTVTTVIGLLPLTYGIGGYDEMMAPMALAMGYGLLFATPITLILLPCLYLIRNDVEAILSRFFNRRKADVFETEPHLLQDVSDGLVMEE